MSVEGVEVSWPLLLAVVVCSESGVWINSSSSYTYASKIFHCAIISVNFFSHSLGLAGLGDGRVVYVG